MRTTVAAALKQFTLINGEGSLDDKTACVMTLLAWLDECDEWTDHPICAHPIITDQVIRANDAETSTPEMRAQLVKLGTKGVLDTWWIPVEVIAWSLAGKRDDPKEADTTQYDRTVRSLKRLIAWKGKKTRPNLSEATCRGRTCRGRTCRGRTCRGRTCRGRTCRGRTCRGPETCRGRTCRGRTCRGRTCRGRTCRGRTCRGRTCRGRTCRGRTCRGRTCRGRTCRGRTCRGRTCRGRTCRANLSGGPVGGERNPHHRSA